MKHIKLFESYFGMDLVKLLEPVYKEIEKRDLKKVESIKSKLIESLDEYKDYVIELVENKYRKDVDIESEILNVDNTLNKHITRDLNLSNFLRTISNIVLIPKRKSEVKIETLFEEYYETLSPRIERAMESVDLNPDDFIDEEEGEESVLFRSEYIKELKNLQGELNKLVEWVVANKKKVILTFDGRDSAGKGSTIKRFIHYMNPKYFKVITMGIPKPEELEGDNWFKKYEAEFPQEGQIAFFDRSWHNMSINNPTFGYCTEEQYEYFMDHVNEFEKKIVDSGIYFVKFWFSITKEKQTKRFDLRKESPLKYWKFSPNDAKAAEKWDDFTYYKERCFSKNSTSYAPWVIVQSNDKRLSQLNSIRYVLDKIPYDGKDENNIGDLYHDVVYELK